MDAITVDQNILLDEFRVIQDNTLKRFRSLNEDIINSYEEESKLIKVENKKTSFLFNSLSFFNIGETLHSYLLAKLLDPNAEHGQGYVFLKCFLEKFGIDVNENDNWVVTAEIGRIDIMLKREFPHSVIIIENKSNYAADQGNQLYRY